MTKKSLYVTILCATGLNAQVGIRTSADIPPSTYTFPHPSAATDVYSTSKGLLLPRINLGNVGALNNVSSPVPSPKQGLIIFNNTANTTVTPNFKKGLYFWDTNSLNNTLQYNKVFTFNETPKTMIMNFTTGLTVLSGANAGIATPYLTRESNPSTYNTILSLDAGYFSKARLAGMYRNNGGTITLNYGIILPKGTYAFDVNYFLSIQSSYTSSRSTPVISNPTSSTNSNFYDIGYFCDLRYVDYDATNSATNPAVMVSSRSETHSLSRVGQKHTASFFYTQTFTNDTFITFNIGRAQGTTYYDAADLLPESYIKITQISY